LYSAEEITARIKEMGAEFDLSGGDVLAQAPPEGLRGANIHFETVTVTGTENIMMAAVLARGRTVISNAAREPEVGDTARALVAMGAKITGLDSDILTIEGVETLQGTKHVVMPDRIEAGTFIIAVALAGGSVCLEAVPYEALNAVLSELKEAGLILEQTREGLLVTAPAQGLTAVSVTTQPYPGFPTDMQAQFMALMTKAEGVSLITETIFENRFMHVSELKRLGADIRLDQRTAVVKGVKTLSGAPMTASDLRASASLLLAALGAQGQSEIFRVYHLDRGYDELDKKLNKLGARIKRVKA
jgi:UDP-N-acetylglucosamine 1-carboxyvinyltransferase